MNEELKKLIDNDNSRPQSQKDLYDTIDTALAHEGDSKQLVQFLLYQRDELLRQLHAADKRVVELTGLLDETIQYLSNTPGLLQHGAKSLADHIKAKLKGTVLPTSTDETYQQNGGWIEWSGGSNPVGMADMVDFMMAENPNIFCHCAGFLNWEHRKKNRLNIVRYRLSKPRANDGTSVIKP
ncbi:MULTISPECIES: hypothetical protein [unclassified Pseudomonas]|uniref:hypothetical protein n=1 Tax=unclassified Pseudomonas TaxID=196821 RepID=UPI00128B433E|nr:MULTISPECIES: hypothetical protein [unclassified Pseudomonas]MPQ68298.1 hypothetical protein [Pseudomonas sp. MWU12-2323]